MRIIIGLGNTGDQYNLTRHNLGFMALDYYFKTHNLSWQTTLKFHSIWAKHDDLIFLKPQTFYNDVGLAAKSCAVFYKISPNNILAICDDFNLEFGQLRFREKGSSGGNNGLKSLEQHLHTTDFPRLRIGTSNSLLRTKIGDTSFVLGHFIPEEREQLPQILSNMALRLDQFLNESV